MLCQATSVGCERAAILAQPSPMHAQRAALYSKLDMLLPTTVASCSDAPAVLCRTGYLSNVDATLYKTSMGVPENALDSIVGERCTLH